MSVLEVRLNVWIMKMVFNVTFNNISVISWRSLYLVEEAGVPGENHRPAGYRNIVVFSWYSGFLHK